MRKWCLVPGLAAALLAAPQTATAAAWPRGEGNGFVSLSHQLQLNETEDQDYSSLFFEYGVSEALSLGLDAGYNPTSRDRSAIVFLSRSLVELQVPDAVAVELGFGAVDIDGERYGVLRPGASWGRGWQIGARSGWTGIEANYAFRGDGSRLGKLDATFGVNHENGSLSILQIQTSKPSDDDWSATLAPAYVRALERDWFVEIGATFKLTNGANALKLGVWKAF